jgi:1A family penicillin-binding protein
VATASKVLDVNGRVIRTLFRENRIEVPVAQIPPLTRKAFIAVEDARFFKHHGIDLPGIARAVVKNIMAGKIVEGGSTITQQTAKNLYLTREKTFLRKFKEAWLALHLERKYTKEQILEMYLNQVYFGEGAYGIEVAARTYFGKPAGELDLAESAMLAGLLKAPNTYSPFQNWEGAKGRQKTVLDRMSDLGMITREEANQAYEERLILASSVKSKGKAPYFVDEVIKYVTSKYENGANLLFTGGLTIETTLDLDMQEAAETAFTDGLAGKDRQLNGALVAMDAATGQIRALVGGRDFSQSKFNRAFMAKRQPGSAFKPFLYTAAIDMGYTAGTTLTCEPASFPVSGGIPYRPTDYGSNPYHNRLFTLKEALAISDNVVAVKLANEIRPASIVDYAKKMGINSKLRMFLSISLGTSEITPLELTGGYTPLANGGKKTKPLFVLKIKDKNGNVLEENKPEITQVIDPKTAYIVTDMMRAVLAPGGTAANVAGTVGRPAAGKTGTTQDYRDAWFAGFTPELVATVYIGYDDPRKPVGATGGRIAAPIWARFVADALKDRPVREFSMPEGLVRVKICADSGLLATPFSPYTIEAVFVDGTEPTQSCPLHSYPGMPPGQGETGETPAPGEGQSPRFLDWLNRLRMRY